ncbi:hypothetical protein K443DRAFT_208210 [Laccaria amethystina LaAM-08-1]|uniref:Uncharacterized protein n=1 Tax=Laccaria amethystina LaAM-08-1 TaxID=1095629 RepID=A0A0C9X048_9AGAR|nr:hypothetical protein K443DRAFT_208210 [Laccaria amethystina LaAM-08-1]
MSQTPESRCLSIFLRITTSTRRLPQFRVAAMSSEFVQPSCAERPCKGSQFERTIKYGSRYDTSRPAVSHQDLKRRASWLLSAF